MSNDFAVSPPCILSRIINNLIIYVDMYDGLCYEG
jgi:hypothetical protein